MSKEEFFKELKKLIDKYETNNGNFLERVLECEINFIRDGENWSWNGENFVLEKEKYYEQKEN